MSKKIGFWSVFAIVTGSQIGTGVFMSPAGLAQYGSFSLIGWLISGFGAIALCLVFASLCSRFPETGGPHAYVNHVFGPTAAFFTGWSYWIISWVSTTAVVVTAIGSLSPFLSDAPGSVYLTLEILLLFLITLLNLKGVQAAGKAEFILILMKFIPLIVIPLVALCYFDSSNFVISQPISLLPKSSILSQVTLLTLWGFIGLECATTPAGEVVNPSKTVPRAIVTGTSCVALLYLLNSIGIMGLIPGQELANSKAPYVDASRIIFGGNWHLLVSCIASIVCIGTLNAWMLASGQVVLGLAQDGLMPQIFARKNRQGAPFFGILTSCFGIIPLLILTTNTNFASQINAIIDFSVTAFLFVYLACCFAFLRLLCQGTKLSFFGLLYGLIATIFCSWIIYETPIKTLFIASAFVLSGIPVYFLWYKRQN
jgi:APA family basic amino acid/polyamine antiporter